MVGEGPICGGPGGSKRQQAAGRGAHRQAILEGGGLGLEGGSMVRRRQASPEGDREARGAGAEALGEVESKSPGGHGRLWRWK